MENALVKLSKAASLLAEAKTLEEVVGIRDIATAAATYARAAKLGLQMQNDAAEIKVTAERKAGSMLAKMPKMDGGDAKRKSLASTTEASVSYESMGIGQTQAHRWQKEALLPEKEFRAYLVAAREQKQEITSKAVYDMARSYEKGNGASVDPNTLWQKPKMPLTDVNTAHDNLFFNLYKGAIRAAAEEAASGKCDESKPAEWLLDNEYRFVLEKKLPLGVVDDWVREGCKTTPLHEVVIQLLNERWGNIDDEQ